MVKRTAGDEGCANLRHVEGATVSADAKLGFDNGLYPTALYVNDSLTASDKHAIAFGIEAGVLSGACVANGTIATVTTTHTISSLEMWSLSKMQVAIRI